MTRKVLSDLFDDGGKTKIHMDEVSDYSGKVLSEIIGVETGSNANGSWIKYPNGWMECFRVVNNPNRGVTTLQMFDFPQEFIEPPFASHSHQSGSFAPYLKGVGTMALMTTETRWVIAFNDVASGVANTPMRLCAKGIAK